MAVVHASRAALSHNLTSPHHPARQVYELRLEAVLAELALMKAQCGVDYSLTLANPRRQLEVLTSGACLGGRGSTA